MMAHGADIPMVEHVLRCYVPPYGPVLEFGCGAARYRRLFGERYTGLDLPDSVYAEGTVLDVSGDARAMPFEDASFAAVFCVCVLHLVDPARQAAVEARRVLREGGPFIVFDYRRKTLEDLARKGSPHSNFWSRGQLRGLLEDAGFSRTVLPALPTPEGRPSALARFLRSWPGSALHEAVSEAKGGWNVVVAYR